MASITNLKAAFGEIGSQFSTVSNNVNRAYVCSKQVCLGTSDPGKGEDPDDLFHDVFLDDNNEYSLSDKYPFLAFNYSSGNLWMFDPDLGDESDDDVVKWRKIIGPKSGDPIKISSGEISLSFNSTNLKNNNGTLDINTSNIPTLTNGKLSASVIPAVALNDTFVYTGTGITLDAVATWLKSQTSPNTPETGDIVIVNTGNSIQGTYVLVNVSSTSSITPSNLTKFLEPTNTYVSYSTQTLSTDAKTQARSNIGAAAPYTGSGSITISDGNVISCSLDSMFSTDGSGNIKISASSVPVATTNTAGTIIVGSNLNVTGDGTLSVPEASNDSSGNWTYGVMKYGDWYMTKTDWLGRVEGGTNLGVCTTSQDLISFRIGNDDPSLQITEGGVFLDSSAVYIDSQTNELTVEDNQVVPWSIINSNFLSTDWQGYLSNVNDFTEANAFSSTVQIKDKLIFSKEADSTTGETYPDLQFDYDTVNTLISTKEKTVTSLGTTTLDSVTTIDLDPSKDIYEITVGGKDDSIRFNVTKLDTDKVFDFRLIIKVAAQEDDGVDITDVDWNASLPSMEGESCPSIFPATSTNILYITIYSGHIILTSIFQLA